jgi:tetratricopeptide (TPR) repeat protein
MSAPDQLDGRVDELGKASRRAAALSLLGLLLVLAAMGYAFVGLRALERQRASLLTERQELIAETDEYRRDLTSVRADLAKSRASLAAARAAINAFHAGRLEDAVALYDEALAADPDNAYIQNLRAYSLFRLGRIEAAIEGQRRSLAADPSYAWGYFDLARFLYAVSPPRLDEARQAEAKAIELRPGMRSIMQADGEFQRFRRHRVP